MWTRTIVAAALAASMALPVGAQDGAAEDGAAGDGAAEAGAARNGAGPDFAKDSQAEGWGNLQGREPARFRARVVDILCELTGDCAEGCGEGKRQMGLVREADGKLILAAKNNQPIFTGATEDLAPYCGETVEVDGLMVGNPDLTEAKFYLVQTILRDGRPRPAKARRWTRIWNRRYPDLAEQKGPWFRKHPPVMEQIARTGWLGLGPDVDKQFIDENY